MWDIEIHQHLCILWFRTNLCNLSSFICIIDVLRNEINIIDQNTAKYILHHIHSKWPNVYCWRNIMIKNYVGMKAMWKIVLLCAHNFYFWMQLGHMVKTQIHLLLDPHIIPSVFVYKPFQLTLTEYAQTTNILAVFWVFML